MSNIGDSFARINALRIVEDRECSQPKKIHLEQAEIVERPHRILRDDFLLIGRSRRSGDIPTDRDRR